MPDYFTHYIMAREILEKCPKTIKQKIKNKTAYMLGAQGGDVFFMYKLTGSKQNVGRQLHTINPALLFEKLRQGDFSYAVGFATHYALDCIFHPIVYAFESTAKTPFAHQKFESDIGLYTARKYSVSRSILPRELILEQSFTLYDSVVKALPEITLTGVERCLKRHFIYTRHLIKSKRTEFIFGYNYSSLDGLFDDAIKLSLTCMEELALKKPLSDIFCGSFLAR